MTTIKFSLSNESHVTIKIYNLLGKEVAVLLDEITAPGVHQHMFYAGDLSSGFYFCHLEVGGQGQVEKMLLIK